MPGMKVSGTRGGIPAPMNPVGGGVTIKPFGISVGCGERASGYGGIEPGCGAGGGLRHHRRVVGAELWVSAGPGEAAGAAWAVFWLRWLRMRVPAVPGAPVGGRCEPPAWRPDPDAAAGVSAPGVRRVRHRPAGGVYADHIGELGSYGRSHAFTLAAWWSDKDWA